MKVEGDSKDRSLAEAVTRPKRNRRIWAIAAAVAVLIAVAAGVGIWAAARYSGAEASSRHPDHRVHKWRDLIESSITYNSNTWTELSPSGTLPLARNTRSLVLDPSSGHLILFGGSSSDSASGDLNDTWAYDPVANTWTNLNPPDPLPAARWGTSMVYVPSIGRLMLFGGASGNTDLNDTWAYDPVANTWTDLKPSGTVPMVRAGHSLVYEPSSGRVFMFGGQTSVQDEDGAVFADLGDIWAYDPAGNTWSKLRPRAPYPVGRYAHSMVYAPSINKLVMFGGWGANGVLNDTWAYDPAANAWTNLTPSGTVPYARYSASMAYDPSTGVALMFGGLISDTKVFNDTWAYDPMANSWKKLSPSGTPPSPRGAHAMSYDPSSGQMIMFGGVRPLSPQAPGQRLNDTWAYAP